ncbi:MAG TPA: hypothetical protein VIR60_05830 [Gammaproteobacteria bacterium]
MNTKRLTGAFAGALLAAAVLLPVTGYADDGYRSGSAVPAGYRHHDRGDRYDGDRHHHRGHHHYRHPHHGYYAPRYYYRPYYRSYYAPAPRYYGYGDSGWSVDLHYFFRD